MFDPVDFYLSSRISSRDVPETYFWYSRITIENSDSILDTTCECSKIDWIGGAADDPFTYTCQANLITVMQNS